jgi:hypothetical protein
MNKSKTDVALNQSKRLRLLRNEPITGSNGYGPYYLYPVVTEQGVEESFFAPEPIHDIIKEHKLKAGDEFILSRVQNGKPGSSKLELSLVSSSSPTPSNNSDLLKETMLQCVRDAVSIVNEVKDEVAFRAEDTRSLSLTLFIAKTKLGNGFH